METNLFSRFFFFFFCFSPDSSSFPGTLSFKNHYFLIYRYLWEVVVNLFELLFDVHPGPRPVPALQLEPPPDRRCVHFVQWRPCRVPLCCFEQGAGAGTKAGPEALYGRLENMSGHRTTSCCCCSCGCKCLNIFLLGICHTSHTKLSVHCGWRTKSNRFANFPNRRLSFVPGRLDILLKIQNLIV